MSHQRYGPNSVPRSLLVFGVLIVVLSAFQGVAANSNHGLAGANSSSLTTRGSSPHASELGPFSPVEKIGTPLVYQNGSAQTSSNQSPMSFYGHYWIGSVTSASSRSGTSVEVTFVTPEDNAVSGDYFYALLSIWDNAQSYDQTGLTSDYGSWQWVWGWTTPCAGTYYYNAAAYTLSYGQQYAVQMQAYSNGTIEFLLYIDYIQSGDLPATHWAYTGGTSFTAEAFYTCGGNQYYDYTDYEEVFSLAQQNVPNWPILFTNNILNGAYQNSWTSFGTGSPPSAIQVVINESNTTIANEGWMGPEFYQLAAARPGVLNTLGFDVANLACSSSNCLIWMSTVSAPSGWTISYSPSEGNPGFSFNALVTIPSGASGYYYFDVELTDISSGSPWNGYYTTFLVEVDVSTCTKHCGVPTAGLSSDDFLAFVGVQPVAQVREAVS